MKEEMILVVPREVLKPVLSFRGFRPAPWTQVNDWIGESRFKPRSAMENDPAYQQIIPYILLRHENEVYRYWRTKRAGEKRLHHLYSLGIGGHIDQRDENLFTDLHELLDEAAMRELREEVTIPESVDLKHIGFINDDESDVGKVHFGIVYEANLQSHDVQTGERALGRGEWKHIHALNDVAYETWSQFLVEDYLMK